MHVCAGKRLDLKAKIKAMNIMLRDNTNRPSLPYIALFLDPGSAIARSRLRAIYDLPRSILLGRSRFFPTYSS
jgi:hypothetical protein